MPVSHSLRSTPNISAELASGISWAYQNGADVINNSWGDQGGQLYNQLYSTILENAILNAMTLGRGNKGTLVVFASGNFGVNAPIMDYPATFNDNILTVGSITNLGQRSIFSSSRASGYGTKLDIVAPGSHILSTLPNNNIDFDSGTSMASPHVAGVCALILSANPSLSGQQVRDIIEKTSQKVGRYSYTNTAGRPNGTWNDQMGYGLVDAFAAVQMACTTNILISGSNTICSGNSTYTVNVPVGSIVTWSLSNSSVASLSNATGNQVTLNYLNNGQVTLTASINPCGQTASISKSIWLGKPSAPASINGPSSVLHGALVRYTAGVSIGATSYEWWLPYPYETVAIFDHFGQNWQKTTNGSSDSSIQVFTGYAGNTGLVQVMGVNECGVGGAVWLNVQFSSDGGGAIARVPNPDDEKIFMIYPNPSNSVVHIELKDKKSELIVNSTITGELFDILGLTRGTIQISSNKATLDVRNLPKGVYILKIDINGQIESHQIAVK